MRYFIYNMHLGNDNNYTVVFDYSSEFDEIKLREDVIDFHSVNGTCRKTIFICPKVNQHIDGGERVKLIAGVFNNSDSEVTLLFFNISGVIIDELNKVESSLIEKIKYYGLFHIVKSRNAVIEGDELFHFVLPSKKHSPFFIRTANILRESCEINFIALCLLDKLKGIDVKYIVCDTSSIISIGYAYSYLRSLFEERPNIPVQSFSSYTGIKSFKFRPRSLVLISATNSGDLEKRLIRTVSEKDLEIVTILYNCPTSTGRLLINLNKDFKDLLIYKKSKHYTGSNESCDYCNRNSIPVLVRGDQFIPSRVIPQKILIYKKHVPGWIKEVMPLISCTKSVTCFKSESIKTKKREIYVDFDILLRSNKKQAQDFRKIVNRTIQNHVPASTTIIVYVNDSASEVVAKKIHKELLAYGKKIIEPIPHHKISEIKQGEADSTHTFVVVAACLATGNKLNSISRQLRDFKQSSVHYISILSRLETQFKLRVLEGNLEFRSDKSENVNVFNSVLCSYLGDYHDRRRTKYKRPSWCEETDFFKQFEPNLLPVLLKERIRNLKSEIGLVDNLFFKNPFNAKGLKLRNNFALYEFKNGKPSQADVFLIVSATFHYLRNPSLKNGKIESGEKFLVQHEHVRSVIDPQIFNRFNDGILQACILRIAQPVELSYFNEDESLEMSRTIIDLFRNSDDVEKNEAILEFLFALAIEKMILLPDHLRHLIEHLESLFSCNLEIMFLIDYIKKTFLK